MLRTRSLLLIETAVLAFLGLGVNCSGSSDSGTKFFVTLKNHDVSGLPETNPVKIRVVQAVGGSRDVDVLTLTNERVEVTATALGSDRRFHFNRLLNNVVAPTTTALCERRKNYSTLQQNPPTVTWVGGNAGMQCGDDW